MGQKGKRSLLKTIISGIFITVVASILTCIGINKWVIYSTKANIVTLDNVEKAQCIMVLGASVKSNGEPSTMLEDRLETAYKVSEQTGVQTFLLSGDHGTKRYDEVNTMRMYLEGKGIIKQNIFLDHAGFSTYESMYRAKEIFEVESMIVVTQGYHLPRALYIAKQLGIEVQGIAADSYTYLDMSKYEKREELARIKDFLFAHILKPKPTYLGEIISITGDGRLSQDK